MCAVACLGGGSVFSCLVMTLFCRISLMGNTLVGISPLNMMIMTYHLSGLKAREAHAHAPARETRTHTRETRAARAAHVSAASSAARPPARPPYFFTLHVAAAVRSARPRPPPSLSPPLTHTPPPSPPAHMCARAGRRGAQLQHLGGGRAADRRHDAGAAGCVGGDVVRAGAAAVGGGVRRRGAGGPQVGARAHLGAALQAGLHAGGQDELHQQGACRRADGGRLLSAAERSACVAALLSSTPPASIAPL